MRLTLLSLLAATLPAVNGVHIVLGNDDGWAEMNIRTLFNTLNANNHDAIISAPATDRSNGGKSEPLCRQLRICIWQKPRR